jgi:hypothetical protein
VVVVRRILLGILIVLMGLLLLAVAGIGVIPMLIVLDLSTGGTGWGLCPEGMSVCESSYFAGPELIAVLVLMLFVGLGLIAGCSRGIKALKRQLAERSS